MRMSHAQLPSSTPIANAFVLVLRGSISVAIDDNVIDRMYKDVVGLGTFLLSGDPILPPD
jgi:hypothetical protein